MRRGFAQGKLALSADFAAQNRLPGNADFEGQNQLGR
jgi:hypothetical protein